VGVLPVKDSSANVNSAQFQWLAGDHDVTGLVTGDVAEGGAKYRVFGVQIMALSPESAKFLDVPGGRGVLLSEVMLDGPEDKPGIRATGVITMLDGRRVTSPKELSTVTAKAEPGKRVKIEIISQSKKRTVDLEVGTPPEQERLPPKPQPPAADGRGWIGVGIRALTPELAKQHKLRDAEGALVVSTEAGGPATTAGIKAGDVIVTDDGNLVRTPADLHALVTESRAGEIARITAFRDGLPHLFQVKLGRRSEPEKPAIADCSDKDDSRAQRYAALSG